MSLGNILRYRSINTFSDMSHRIIRKSASCLNCGSLLLSRVADLAAERTKKSQLRKMEEQASRRVTRDDGMNLRWDIAKSTSTNIFALTSWNGLRVSREVLSRLVLSKEETKRKKSTPNTLFLIEQKPTDFGPYSGKAAWEELMESLKLCFQLRLHDRVQFAHSFGKCVYYWLR